MGIKILETQNTLLKCTLSPAGHKINLKPYLVIKRTDLVPVFARFNQVGSMTTKIQANRQRLKVRRHPRADNGHGFFGIRARWPGRHGHADCSQRLIGCGPELKVCAQRNGQAKTGHQCHRFFNSLLFAPHLAPAVHHEPDLINGCVRHGGCDLPDVE